MHNLVRIIYRQLLGVKPKHLSDPKHHRALDKAIVNLALVALKKNINDNNR